MTLSDRLARRAGQVVEITLFRDWMGLPLPVAVPVRPREPTEMPVEGPDGPLGVSPLGCACRVLNQIDRVVAGSPAAKAGIQAGDLLTEARLVPPLREVLENLQYDQPEVPADLGPDSHLWPAVMFGLQERLPGTKVKLSYVRPPRKAVDPVTGSAVFDVKDLKAKTTDPLDPLEARDRFTPYRGI